MECQRLLSKRGRVFERLWSVVLLEGNGRFRIDSFLHIRKSRSAHVHPECPVGRGIKNIAGVADEEKIHAHFGKDPLHLPDVSDAVPVKAHHNVDQVRLRSLLAGPEMLQDSLQRIVVAGDVRPHEGRGMGKGNIVFLGNRSFFLRVLDEGIQIVPDHLGHAGGGDGDHLGLVHGIGVGQAIDHVVEPPEDCRILCHGGRDAGGRLLEMPGEMAPVVGDAPLGSVDEGECLLETQSQKNGAERLAGLGGIDGQGLPLEVEFAVFLGLGPLDDFRDLLLGMGIFKVLLLVFEHLHIFRLPEQVEVVEDVLGVLAHCRILFLWPERRAPAEPYCLFPLRRAPSPSATPDC